MVSIRFAYRAKGQLTEPIAELVIGNPVSRIFHPFPALIDTGADRSVLDASLLVKIALHPGGRPTDKIEVAGKGFQDGWLVHVLLGVRNTVDGSQSLFNHGKPIEIGFAVGTPPNILGRDRCLDSCKVIFDGPAGTVTFEF